ncbi:hypothetical protein N7451_007231 [Penicillium sp. IBT 35674x]|nr:hypothetical protein N7451_007231 [Penicillium sp. IBT 35674x]
MSPSGAYEYAETLDPQQAPTAPRQEEEWPTFDPALLNTVGAPATPWFQEEYFNPQYTGTPFSAFGHGTLIPTTQRAEHQELYRQTSPFDTRSTQGPTLQDRRALSTEATLHQPQGTAGPRPEIIKCYWRGCQYTGTFGRKTDLMRHLETQHVSPKAYKCSFPGCTKEYNRDDNLQGHLRRDHGLTGLYR